MKVKSQPYYTPEFKAEAVKLVLEKSQSIAATSNQLGMTKQTLHAWITKAKDGTLTAVSASKATHPALEAQVKQLKQALARAEMERDILKKATAYFHAQSCRFSGLGWRG